MSTFYTLDGYVYEIKDEKISINGSRFYREDEVNSYSFWISMFYIYGTFYCLLLAPFWIIMPKKMKSIHTYMMRFTNASYLLDYEIRLTKYPSTINPINIPYSVQRAKRSTERPSESVKDKGSNLSKQAPDKSEDNLEEVRAMPMEFPFEDKSGFFLDDCEYSVPVKGFYYTNFDPDRISINEQLLFHFEPDNPADPNAILVLYDYRKIGYVPRTEIQSLVREYIKDKDKTVRAFVTSVNKDARKVTMAIGFYSKPDPDIE